MEDFNRINPVILALVFTIFSATVIVMIKSVKIALKVENSGLKIKSEYQGKIKKLFVETYESFVTCLGNGYIESFFTKNALTSGFSIVTNKRVYFKGKCYSTESRKLRITYEERVVDLKDVTGTGYKKINPIFLLISSIVTLLIAVSLHVYSNNIMNESTYNTFEESYSVVFVEESKVENAKKALVVGVALYSLYSLLLVIYILKRRTLFEISFAGGNIAFDTFLYNKIEIEEFQRKLRKAKDNIIETNSAHIQYESINDSLVYVGVADELKKYGELFKQNLISLDEYEKVKQELLNQKNSKTNIRGVNK